MTPDLYAPTAPAQEIGELSAAVAGAMLKRLPGMSIEDVIFSAALAIKGVLAMEWQLPPGPLVGEANEEAARIIGTALMQQVVFTTAQQHEGKTH